MNTITIIKISLFTIVLLMIGLSVDSKDIPLKKEGGIYTLPLRINGVITLDFILDSGASEVCVPADVVMTLLRAHTIEESDFLPGKSYSLADGSVVRSERFIIRELESDGIKILNVAAVIAPVQGSLLLGQSFLEKLDSWTIDNQRRVLIVGDSRSGESNQGTQTKTPPPTLQTQKESMNQFNIGQRWILEWKSQYYYQGVLEIKNKIDHNRYISRISVKFKNEKNIQRHVSFDGLLIIQGNDVIITCSNPSVSWWVTDDFHLKLNKGFMEGYSVDKSGRRGYAKYRLVDSSNSH